MQITLAERLTVIMLIPNVTLCTVLPSSANHYAETKLGFQQDEMLVQLGSASFGLGSY